MQNFGFYLTFTVAMVTGVANKVGLKWRNCHFWLNLRLLETNFSKIRYQHRQIPKKPFNMLCVMNFLIIC